MNRRMILPSAVIAALILAATGALIAQEVQTDEERTTFESQLPGLTTSNRSVRSLCVDGAAGHSVSDRDVDVVLAAAREALDGIKDAYAFLEGELPVEAVKGCPPPMGLTGTPGPRVGRIGRGVAEPSIHSVFVYIVPEDVYADNFADYPYGRAGEEFYCIRRSECSSVTEGLYITPTTDPATLQEGLLDSMGFLQALEP